MTEMTSEKKKMVYESLINSDSYKSLPPELKLLTEDSKRLNSFICGYYEDQVSEIMSADLGPDRTKAEIEELNGLILEVMFHRPD